MSTVLEKPVLLDETGQEIVDKLDEIKSAISSGGEYIPLAIRVTTPPTKTTYYAGDSLDLSGIVVSLVGSNGSLIDVTSACTFSPANGATLSTSDTSVAITYHYEKDNVDFTASQTITVNAVAAISIAVTTPPTKTSYFVDDILDLTGIVVTATKNNGTTADVTSNCTFSPANGATLSDATITAVNVSYINEIGETLSTTQSITISYQTYGVQWEGTADSAFNRIGAAAAFTEPNPYYAGMTDNPSSPFDTIMPWAGMEKVTDPDAGVLVKIPKYWYKITTSPNFKIEISNQAIPGFNVSPAHADRGDGEGERDYVYVAAYNCASDFKSTSGVTPKNKMTRGAARSSIHNLGSDIWQYDVAMFFTIAFLYLVEYADWNSQKCIGFGNGTGSPTTYYDTTGCTDSIPYHTGTTASDRTSSGAIKYRNIEGLWSGQFFWVDGIYIAPNSSDIEAINTPANFAETGGELVGTSIGAGVPTAIAVSATPGFEYIIYPTQVDSSSGSSKYDTYLCDYYGGVQNRTYAHIPRMGCTYAGYGADRGLFMVLFEQYDDWGTSTYNGYGCRLMKLP